MLCLKCGREIENTAKFCPYCGAVTAVSGSFGPEDVPVASLEPDAPAYTAAVEAFGVETGAPPAPSGAKKRWSFGPIIGGAVAAVAVVALLAVALISLFESPKGQVAQAFAKTAAAYADAGEQLGLPDLSELIQSRCFSQHMSLRLNSVNEEMMGESGLSSMEGLGIRMGVDCDQKGRKLDYELAAFLGDRDIMSFQLLADDETMAFAIPQFMGESAYGFNTEMLGADLKRMGADGGEIDLETLSFNLFDLMESDAFSNQMAEEQAQALEEARQKLFDAAEVAKLGSRSIKVNGSDVNAVLYHMTISQWAMEDYVDALGEAMTLVDSQELMRQIFQSMGLDESFVDEMLSGMGTQDVYGEFIGAMKEALDILGDLELDIYVSDGYLCAVEYAREISGSSLKLGLYLGGGEYYADDLSLEITVDGETFVIESSGDHSGRSGVFTDETVFRMRSGWSSAALVTSKMSYDLKSGDGNLWWSIGMSGVSLDMTGRLTAGKDSVELRLDDMSMSMMGNDLISFGMDYYLGPCTDMTVSMPAIELLSNMSEEELLAWAEGIEANVEAWSNEWEAVFQASLSV